MITAITIGAALLLLTIVGLIVRELLTGREAAPDGGAGPTTMRQVATPGEDLEVTKMGVLPSVPRIPAADPDAEREPSASGASPLTIYEGDALEGVDEPTGPVDLIVLHGVGHTDTGKKRRKNEDCYLALAKHGVYAVADGMGGHAGGDVASRLAVETIRCAFETSTFEGKPNPKRPHRGNELVWAVEAANKAVHDGALTNPEFEGMGTTLVATRFSAKKQRVFVAHVGDSRCYRRRGKALMQLTTDHTMGNLGVTGPYANRLSRALGVAAQIKVDLIIDTPLPGDTYLLCSDGLSKMVTDERVSEVLEREPDVQRAADQLIQLANAGGGLDNVTVILLRIEDPVFTMPTQRR